MSIGIFQDVAIVAALGGMLVGKAAVEWTYLRRKNDDKGCPTTVEYAFHVADEGIPELTEKIRREMREREAAADGGDGSRSLA